MAPYRINNDTPLIEDDGFDITELPTADYRGIAHAWECPECLTIGYEDFDIDPREVGILVTCSECGWSGKVE